MRILIANDDGFDAPGIKALAKALKPLGEITVVAPDSQQTGKGHSLSVGPLKVVKTPFDEDIMGYRVSGTPKDCVDVALTGMFPDYFDMVVTGINEGPNLCNDSVSSGTIGCAMAAFILGVPSIATSLDFGDEYDYDRYGETIREIVSWFAQQDFRHDFMLSVNLPNTPRPKGTVIAETGGTHHFPYRKLDRQEGNVMWYVAPFGEVETDSCIEDLDHDLYALQQGYIVISPLHYDLVVKEKVPMLRESWNTRR